MNRQMLLIPMVMFLLLPFLSGQVDASLQEKEIPTDPALITGTLDNGLQYFIRHNEKPEDRAELRLVVRAGSLQEDPDQLGLAHFVEHMAFNGTTHFEKNELVDYIESVGTRFGPDLNAYTSFGETVYMLQARTDSVPLLEKALLILEDWASGLRFDPEEINKERGVVISEWRSRLSPDQRMQQQYFPVLYEGSRYAERLPIGDPEIIDTADYPTIRRFYKDWYRPELMAVVAVGDVDTTWMKQEIIRRFSTLKNPASPRSREEYLIPGHEETRVIRVTDEEAAFTRVQVLFKHPEHEVDNLLDYREQLAHMLYNRMLNGRLFEVQQQQADPPFTFAYSGYGGDLGNQDVYFISAMTAENRLLEGLRAVLKETYRARQHGFRQTELERKKAEIMRSVEQAAKEKDKQSSGGLAGSFVSMFLRDNPVPDPEQRLEIYRRLMPTIELSDINPLPREWLTVRNRVIILTGPEKEKTVLPSEDDLKNLLEEVEQASFEPYVDEVTNASLLDKNFEPVAVKDRKEFDTLEVTELVLENGVRIVLKATDFQNDQILMSSFSPGGHSLYADSLYQSASTAAGLINLGGVGSFSITELNKKLAGKEVNAGPYIDELYEGIRGRCSSEDLETLLKLTYLYFTQPRKDSIAFESFLTRQRSIVENMFTNPYYYFAEAKNQIKYDNHPRRQMTTEEDLRKISLDQAYDIYRDRFADASDFTFFFVGNFDKESLIPMLQRYLGHLPSIFRKESWKDVGARLASGKIDTVIVRGKAPKALVELTFHGDFNYQDSKERYDFYSMLSLLRIKLRESMREDQGGVYGVRVSGVASQHPRSAYRITLSFNAEPGEADSLISTALATIEAIKKDGATEKDLQKVRETQRQSRIKNLKENGFWLGQLTARYREDIPLEGIRLEVYETYIEGLKAMDIQDAARDYLKTGRNFMEIVLMPETKDTGTR